ncbi:MAG: DUF177 domain-containing protein [Acidobacteriota bacterium]|nr:DUF177 domain-containing protein [Acidobacteriota bacterium]
MIDLQRLPAEGLRVEGTVERLSLEDGTVLRDLAWMLFVLPSDRDVFLEVKGTALWEGACSRCLVPLDRPLSVFAQFLGSGDPELVARGAHTLGSQDLDVVFLPEATLDELALVREQFELQAPMRPLCGEACKGLCPVCGKNWNKGPCQCRPESGQGPSAFSRALARALGGIKLDPEP